MDTRRIIEYVENHASPLRTANDLDPLIEAIGDTKYVLLGEASHGTSEFYRLRAELSKRLVREKGFSFIAVEGDWPACYDLNRYVKGYVVAPERLEDALQGFRRWPTWMWANNEIRDLANWLKAYNQSADPARKVGFYGLDVYSLWESMDEIVAHLERTGSSELAAVKQAFDCFEPYGRDAQTYGLSANYLSERCEDELVDVLLQLPSRAPVQHPDTESALALNVNAVVALHAERYYRAMFHHGSESWNIRDRHMVTALENIAAFYGPNSKAIVWAHNTHVGDARATDMVDQGEVNVGQLVREQHGPGEVFAVGFGTHYGTVIAATGWGDPMQTMTVPPAIRDSWEDLLHRARPSDQLLIFGADADCLREPLGHRAIGVVYHPQYERGNYVPSFVANRYDAFLYVDQSTALHPIAVPQVVV